MPSRSGRTDLPDRIEVGRVLKPHGIRGDLRIEILSDVAERFARGARLDLATPTGRRTVTVESLRDQGKFGLLRLEGCADRDTAEGLRGAILEIARDRVPPAADGTWYTFELVGCHCRDASAGDLGKVVDLLEDGGGWILEVSDGHRTLPVPLVRSFLERVDVDAGEIDLRLPEGLVETCASEF